MRLYSEEFAPRPKSWQKNWKNCVIKLSVKKCKICNKCSPTPLKYKEKPGKIFKNGKKAN